MDNTIYKTKNIFDRIPRIGMRIVKSAIGVFLCYLVNLLRGGNGIVFYSQLAVLWCMQDYVSQTKEKALQRTVGTAIGAVWGLIVILTYMAFGTFFGKWGGVVYGLFVSIAIVLVLYTTVLLNKRQASYFSCVVLLSIVVNHITDINPYMFVLNRVLDTMIGIAIGVFVNCFSLPKTKDRDVLFLSGLDDTLLNPQGSMSDYSRVELNRMIEDGAKFSISTIRTPASLMKPLKDVQLKLPVIVMDGAALFNISEKRYEYAYVISPENSSEMKTYFEKNSIPYFANVIIDDLLIIYYQDTDHTGYNELINRLRSSPYRNYIRRPLPNDESVVYFMIIEPDDVIRELKNRISQEPIFDKYKIVTSPSVELEGYSMLKIYSHNATKENMIDYLKNKLDVDRIVTFGTIEGKYDHVIKPGDFNKVVKLMKKDYER